MPTAYTLTVTAVAPTGAARVGSRVEAVLVDRVTRAVMPQAVTPGGAYTWPGSVVVLTGSTGVAKLPLIPNAQLSGSTAYVLVLDGHPLGYYEMPAAAAESGCAGSRCCPTLASARTVTLLAFFIFHCRAEYVSNPVMPSIEELPHQNTGHTSSCEERSSAQQRGLWRKNRNDRRSNQHTKHYQSPNQSPSFLFPSDRSCFFGTAAELPAIDHSDLPQNDSS